MSHLIIQKKVPWTMQFVIAPYCCGLRLIRFPLRGKSKFLIIFLVEVKNFLTDVDV